MVAAPRTHQPYQGPSLTTPGDDQALLAVRNLKTQFFTQDGIVKAVDDVSFYVMPGETLGIVGESGCGKSMTGLSIMRLIPSPPGKITAGEIVFNGRDVLRMSEEQVRSIRGNDIAMIFQDPMTSLNPVLTINRQISEALELHMDMNKDQAKRRSVELLTMVGIPNADERVDQYPHQFSGGMRQRVMIAMALSCNPKLLIADEPTTALDVTIQAQILELIKKIQADTGTALLLITHDLGVVAEMVHDVVVMYAGRVVESGSVEEVLLQPKHPYTEGLLASIPSKGMRGQRLNVIKGAVPNPFNMPVGCNFTPRCPYAFEPCPQHDPRIDEGGGPPAACWLWKQAPGYEIPQDLHDAQVAAARKAAQASTEAVIPVLASAEVVG